MLGASHFARIVMTDLKSAGAERAGLRLFMLFGIEIRLDWSVLIIFTLIVYSLGAGLFPQWHPDWAPATAWLTALAAGVIFFASLLAHHAVSVRRHGRDRGGRAHAPGGVRHRHRRPHHQRRHRGDVQ
jgi:hypothetical protein